MPAKPAWFHGLAPSSLSSAYPKATALTATPSSASLESASAVARQLSRDTHLHAPPPRSGARSKRAVIEEFRRALLFGGYGSCRSRGVRPFRRDQARR